MLSILGTEIVAGFQSIIVITIAKIFQLAYRCREELRSVVFGKQKCKSNKNCRRNPTRY